MRPAEITVKLRLDSEEFQRDLKRLHQQTRRARNVPEWCYVPWMRGFVMGSAFAGPVIALIVAVTQ